MPRSGSTLLTRTLLASGQFGYPDEWFNYDPGAVAENYVSEGRGNTFYSYLSYVQETATSSNGVFGVQLSCPQLGYLKSLVPLSDALGPHACWFLLRRRNLVAQAISLYKANTTGRFHSYQEVRAEAVYDADALAGTARAIMKWEHDAFAFFRESKVWPIELYYEDIVDDRFTMAVFRNALQIAEEAEAGPTIGEVYAVAKMATSENTDWEASFRSDRRDELAEVERERPRILMPFPDTNVETS